MDPEEAELDSAASGEPLTASEQRQVEVLGDRLLAVQTAEGIYLPVRVLCEALGLERKAQVRRIQRDETLREDLRDISVVTEGGRQTMQFLRLETVPYWLSGVTVSKVKPELQEKLRAYKRWVIRKVYEAFMAEGNTLTSTPGSDSGEWMQIRALGVAIQRMADEALELDRRVTTVSTRMDKAAAVVQEMNRRLTHVERRLDPANTLTPEQQAVLTNRVKALAVLVISRNPTAPNPFQGIWTEIFRAFLVSDSKHIRQEQFAPILAWLDDWLRAHLGEGGPAADPAPPGPV